MTKFLKIAHRGHTISKKTNTIKENTINAFVNAKKNGFDMIELDIQLCKNNTIVIYHDLYINNKFINELTYKELIKIDKDIITLDYFFSNYNYKSIMIYLDLKGSTNLARYLFFYIITKKIDLTNIYIASFNLNHIKFFSQINLGTNIKLGLIFNNIFSNKNLYDIINSFYKLSFVCVDWTNLDKNNIELLHKNNINIFTYTCKNKIELEYIKRFDIDGIISDILL